MTILVFKWYSSKIDSSGFPFLNELNSIWLLLGCANSFRSLDVGWSIPRIHDCPIPASFTRRTGIPAFIDEFIWDIRCFADNVCYEMRNIAHFGDKLFWCR